MKVSFVMPAYKRRFLREAIASVLAQTYGDFELVVVDDCSPEDLKGIVDEFRDERISYHRNERNLGGDDLVAAWNHAMGYARGEWCVLASDDDLYQPTFLQELMSLRARHPQCDLLQGREVVIGESGEWRRIASPRQALSTQIRMVQSRCILRTDQFAAEFCFRRSAWQEIGGFVKFPDAIFSDDATWLLLARKGVACSANPLMLFRESGLNVSLRTDNIAAKLKACVQYQSWMSRFLDGLVPCDGEERQILQSARSEVPARIFEIERSLLSKIGAFGLWRKSLRDLHLSRRQKVQVLLDRYPALRALVRLTRSFAP